MVFFSDNAFTRGERMNQIKFSHNWNDKLDNEFFTTIRKYSVVKYDYYVKLINTGFQVMLNNEHVSDAVLLQVESMRYIHSPYSLRVLDTGIVEAREQAKLFNRFGINDALDKVLVLTFQRLSD